MTDPSEGGGDRLYAAVIALALLGVLLVVGAVGAYGTFVMTTGDTLEAEVQAGAAVESNATAGTVRVTWASNQNADRLVVSTAGGTDVLRVAGTTGPVSVTDDGVVLGATGASVVLERRPDADAGSVELVVVAERDAVSTVILAEDVALAPTASPPDESGATG